MNLNLIAIGKFIQDGRKHYAMTQAELAEKLDVSPQSVSNWERGESLPDAALLPDLAKVLHCSVDSILMGGDSVGIGGYRRYVTYAQMCEALNAINRIGELLGRDNQVYRLMIDGINNGMNTTIENAFTDPKIFEIFAGECLIQCVRNGDYADPRDVMAHMQPSQCRDYILHVLEEVGIR